ncbi:Glucosamine--fructose-6-phosphate aminotransferase 1 [Tritrichomonas musculus]|uniref:glutamine--fructose-6-phosphate transaminase (isomerizing) n=1 Tax=Tritrichomonas musculus TaxID=1915356 RepID=A0ABR2JKC3_9EUKA
MCGIFAYLNFLTDKTLKEILIRVLNSLQSLEYRGYDSCGVSFDILDENKQRKSVIVKTPGDIQELEKIIKPFLREDVIFHNHVAIGHTRWATHGKPTAANSHPHYSSPNLEFIVCHNGIISNYKALKDRLLREPLFSISKNTPQNIIYQQTDAKAEFTSETDSEILAKLALFVYNSLYEQHGVKPSFLTVIANTMKLVEGTYACIFKSTLYPNEVVACKLSSPLLLGLKYSDQSDFQEAARLVKLQSDSFVTVTDSSSNTVVHTAPKPCELFLASDAPAFTDFTNKSIVLEDWDIVHITSEVVDIINTPPQSSTFKSSRIVEDLSVSIQNISLGNYPHFMLKEIMEQPITLSQTIKTRLDGVFPHLHVIQNCKTLRFIGCGSSYNACVAVRPLFEQFTNRRIILEVASDFNDRKPTIFRDDCNIFISQSGETADTLVSLDYCRKEGSFCIGVTNTPGSSLSRNTDCSIFMNAGTEIGVASTKSFSSSVVSLLMFLLLLIEDSVKLQSVRKQALEDLHNLPTTIEKVLSLQKQIEELSDVIKEQKQMLILGRRTNYGIARETSMKMEELTYAASEGMMAGELKHGPLALIDNQTFVIFFANSDDVEVRKQCLTSLQQIKARNAQVLLIATEDQRDKINGLYDHLLIVPETSQWVQMIVNIVPMQLLAYYVACKKGINVDRPRNLAKSVTVV